MVAAGGGGGGLVDSPQLKYEKSGWGTYTLYLKNRLKSILLKTNTQYQHICNFYIKINMFIKQNFNFFEK